jgi:hypothetical protein
MATILADMINSFVVPSVFHTSKYFSYHFVFKITLSQASMIPQCCTTEQ